MGRVRPGRPVPVVRRRARARARARRPLADGHDAWLVVRLRRGPSGAQRSEVLQGHAGRPRQRAPMSWPRAFRDRCSPGTCSTSIRPITLGCVVWSRRRSRSGASRRCGRGCRRSSTIFSTPSPPRVPTALPIWWRRSRSRSRSPSSASSSAFPSRTGWRSVGSSRRCSARCRRRRPYARAKGASDAVVAMLTALVEAKQDAPGDDLVTGLLEREGRGRAARPSRSCCRRSSS